MADPIAPPDTRYFIGPAGNIVSADPVNAAVYSQSDDYVEASPEQARDAQLQAKYGGAGQQAKTILEGVARGATLGLSTPIETGIGLAAPEDIEGRQKANPWESSGAESVGVALPSVLSGGATTLESLGAKGAAAGIREAAEYLPVAAVSRAGQAITEGLQGASAIERGVSGVAPSLARRVLDNAGAHAVGSAIEGTAFGAGHVVHEKALGDPNLTASSVLAEVGLTGLVGGLIGGGVGAITEGVPGVMAKLTGAGVDSESLAQKEALWTAQSIAGGAPIRREFDYLEKSLGRANAEKLIREMGARGIDSPFASLRVKDSRADALMAAAKIGDLVDQASEQVPRMDMGLMFAEMRDEILKPIADNKWSAAQGAARKFSDDLIRHETDIGTRGGATLRDLYDLRIDTDKAIDASGGFDGPDAFYNGALRDFRKKLNDRIKDGFEQSNIPKEVYEERLRMYQVGRAAKDFTRSGLNSEYNGSKGGVGGGLGFLGTGMIVHALGGGLPGTIGAYVGIGTLRRYAPGILAAAARKLRSGATREEVAASLQKTVSSLVEDGKIPTEPPPVHPITGEPLGEVVPRSGSPFIGAQPDMAGAQTMMGATALPSPVQDAAEAAHAEFEALRDRIAAHPSMDDETKQRIVRAAMKKRDAKLDDIEELDGSPAPIAPAASKPVRPIDVLPHALRGAKPQFGMGSRQFALNFDNDVDKALFIAAQKEHSSADQKYMEFLRGVFPDRSDATIRSMGSEVKSKIKHFAKNAEEDATTLDLEKMTHYETPSATPSPSRRPAAPNGSADPVLMDAANTARMNAEKVRRGESILSIFGNLTPEQWEARAAAFEQKARIKGGILNTTADDAAQDVADQTAKDIAGQRQSASVQPQPTPAAPTANVPLPSMGDGAPVMPTDPTAVAPTKAPNPADSIAENATSAPETVRALAALERNNQKVQSKIGSMASTLVRMGPRAGAVARSEVLAGLSRSFAKSPEDARKQYDKRVELVQRFGAPAMAPSTAPMPVQPYIPAPAKGGKGASAHIGKVHKLHLAEGGEVATADLDATPPGAEPPPPGISTLQRATFDMDEHAPVTAQAVQQTIVRGMSYLQSQIPDTAKTSPLGPARTPNREEISRFTRAWEAVEDPIQILKAAAAGTLQPDAVQAVEAVHPALLNAMRTTVLDKLATHGAPDRMARRSISTLMGEDMDGMGALTGFNQTTYSQLSGGQPTQPNNTAKPLKTGMSAIKSGDRTATNAQKVESLT